MTDWLLGLAAAALVAGLALGGWIAGTHVAGRLKGGAADAVAAVALLVTGGAIVWVNHAPSSLPLVWILSPLIWLEHAYYIPTAALFFGIGAARIDRPETARGLRGLTVLVVFYAAGHVVLTFDARHHPDLQDSAPAGPVAAQTTAWSCGAAASVTLLKAHGITSTEREMGELCLTLRQRGTSMPRFIRGLTRKIEQVDAPLRVVAADHLSIEELDEFPKPCLVALSLTFFVDHATVLFERLPDGRVLMGDPMDGKPILYDAAELADRFTGEAVALVPR